jgi:hypothetical protein
METTVQNDRGAVGEIGRRETDARARSRATLAQGAVAAGILAALFSVMTATTALEFSPAVVAALAATAGTTPAITYLQRAYLDPYRKIRRMCSPARSNRPRHPRHAQTV